MFAKTNLLKETKRDCKKRYSTHFRSSRSKEFCKKGEIHRKTSVLEPLFKIPTRGLFILGGGLLVILKDCMIFFVTIPRCYKDIYVNSFFPCTATLWNYLATECFPLTYDLSGFKTRINRHLLTVGSF